MDGHTQTTAVADQWRVLTSSFRNPLLIHIYQC